MNRNKITIDQHMALIKIIEAANRIEARLREAYRIERSITSSASIDDAMLIAETALSIFPDLDPSDPQTGKAQ